MYTYAIIAVLFVASTMEAAKPKVSAIQAEFLDHGIGDAAKPQEKALALVGDKVAKRDVGVYRVLSNGEHGESTFCVANNTYATGKQTDLESLYLELEKLKPAPAEEYELRLTKQADCGN